MEPHLQCAEQQVSPSNLTKYCACHAKWLLCLILVTYETSFTMRGVTNVTIQPHQILRLPRKMTLQHVRKNVRKRMKRHFQCGADPSMIRPWSDHETVSPQPASQPRLLFEPTTSIFYCKIQRFAPNLTFQLSPSTAPATKSGTWTSPNTAPATKSDTWTSPSTSPATKSDTWTWLKTAPATKSDTWTSPSTAPATQNDSNAWSSSHMKRHLQCAEQQVSPSNLTKYCACHAKWLLCLILVTYETSFTMRGVTNVTIQPHQILRLPRKMTLQHVRKNVRKRMKRHFQCGADPSMIRPWSDHETVSPQPASQPRLLFEPTTSIFYCKIQRFAPNLTFQLSPSTAPATKSGTWTSPNTAPATKSDTWTSPSTAPATKSDTWTWLNTAPATKSDTWTSPSTAPATQNDSNAWSSSYMKRHLQCAEQQVSPSNLTKYCACHAKWLLCLILVTYETSFTMRGVTNVTIQPHQILRLPRKMTLQHVRKNVRKRMKRHFQCGADPSMIRPWSDHETVGPQPASQPRLLFEPTTSIFYCKIQRFAPNLTFQLSPSTAPATKSDTWTSPNTAPATKSDTWTSPNTAPATKSDTWTSPSTSPATKSDTWTWLKTAPATKSDTWTSPSTTRGRVTI